MQFVHCAVGYSAGQKGQVRENSQGEFTGLAMCQINYMAAAFSSSRTVTTPLIGHLSVKPMLLCTYLYMETFSRSLLVKLSCRTIPWGETLRATFWGFFPLALAYYRNNHQEGSLFKGVSVLDYGSGTHSGFKTILIHKVLQVKFKKCIWNENSFLIINFINCFTCQNIPYLSDVTCLVCFHTYFSIYTYILFLTKRKKKKKWKEKKQQHKKKQHTPRTNIHLAEVEQLLYQ